MALLKLKEFKFLFSLLCVYVFACFSPVFNCFDFRIQLHDFVVLG